MFLHSTFRQADGQTTFIKPPYAKHLKLTQALIAPRPRVPLNGTIPNEVVRLTFTNSFSLIRAWREYLGISQLEMASRLAVPPGRYAAMEACARKHGKATRRCIANALGVLYKQIEG